MNGNASNLIGNPVAHDPAAREQKSRRKRRRGAKAAPIPALAVDVGDICGGLFPFTKSWWWSQWAGGRTPLGTKIGKRRIWLRAELEQWAAAGFPPRSAATARAATQQTNDRLDKLGAR